MSNYINIVITMASAINNINDVIYQTEKHKSTYTLRNSLLKARRDLDDLQKLIPKAIAEAIQNYQKTQEFNQLVMDEANILIRLASTPAGNHNII